MVEAAEVAAAMLPEVPELLLLLPSRGRVE